jgi:transcriptional regulator with GAF, ATPase, and Fis domain
VVAWRTRSRRLPPLTPEALLRALVDCLRAASISRQLERALVVQALEPSAWNQTKAAALLGVNRDQSRYRIEKFQLGKAS